MHTPHSSGYSTGTGIVQYITVNETELVMREALAHNPRTCQKEHQQLWSALRVGAYAMGGFPDPRRWDGNGFPPGLYVPDKPFRHGWPPNKTRLYPRDTL